MNPVVVPASPVPATPAEPSALARLSAFEAEEPFFQPRRAAFWLMVALLLLGLWSMGQLYLAGLRVVPIAAVLALFAWALYARLFMAVFGAMDLLAQHRPAAYGLAFAWGGLAAPTLAAPANRAIQSIAAKQVSPEFAATWGPALAGPITEEFLKLAGVLLLVQMARRQFRTELSVLIVGAMAGLGFQVMENLAYTVRAAINFPQENQVYPVLWNLLSRGVLSGLWTHAAFSAVAAYGVAWYMRHKERSRPVRIGVALACFGLAWGMHFVWNSPWLERWFPNNDLGVSLLMVTKGLPLLLAAALIWRAATRETGAYLHAQAEALVPERDLLADDERERLGDPLERLRARRAVGREHGRRAMRLKRRLQREQLRLVLKASIYGRGRRTLKNERRIRRLRETLGVVMEPRAGRLPG
ncbi:PrsW family intramembrane metalloprotease [Pseudacidovorax sp. RU35E]|uniref:PrsW family intramembrane metalloprotease n=1 Tax=Pseudacidovorax sp. RU35E TaxID=1907403 RepID=UPI000954A2F2|nr:PrsW family intramembrane metalloprotease [Pseudacidovorax sp. RU35E]SIR67989.1 Protease prsW family protein [Pseudacidovorax sp. RU35E]